MTILFYIAFTSVILFTITVAISVVCRKTMPYCKWERTKVTLVKICKIFYRIFIGAMAWGLVFKIFEIF